MHKKVPTIMALAAVYFAGVPVANAFLPDPHNPTSAVAFHNLEIPGLECEQGLGYLKDTPSWECDGVTIYAKSSKTSQEPNEYLPRQHRAFNYTSQLPQAVVDDRGQGVYQIEDFGNITVGLDRDGDKDFFHLDGPNAAKYAERIKEHA
ncbi:MULTISPECIES: hypothetical protein [Corynebacterium]|uniref:hypothetical protein n=1 Tax=Corynebacterium TaxID=1716 RepID=UPI000B2C958B|nr:MULTISPECIES: hypothetical protein [Corynebacterium]MBF9012076.1 hypothetical protein [Corynebacterium phoceense]